MTTVDQQEINKFNQLAANWWDPTGPMQPLHQLNPVRLGFIEQQTSINNKTILDIGCGAGLLTEAMAKKGARTTGIDAGNEVITVAQQHAADQPLTINYQCTSAEDFLQANPNTHFDIITCMELLEHVDNPNELLTTCWQLLKPGGLLFLSTINRTAKAFLFAIVGAEYLTRKLPIGTHHYQKFIRPAELEEWAQAAGFVLTNIQGMHYRLLQQDFTLAQDVSINYITCHQKPVE